MRFFVLLFLYFTAFFLPLSAHSIILIFGSSACGKSTLAKSIQEELSFPYIYLDRDILIEEMQKKALSQDEKEFIEEKADFYLIQEALFYIDSGFKVIIDTQDPSFIQNILKEDSFLSILVYAPLQTLIERDEKRAFILKRSKERSFYARAFILNTFSSLYSIEKIGKEIDLVFLKEVDQEYPLTDCTFFENISNKPCFIYSKNHFDLFFNSYRQSKGEMKSQSLEAISSSFLHEDLFQSLLKSVL